MEQKPSPETPKVKVAWKVAIFMAVLMMKRGIFSFDELIDEKMEFIRDHVRETEGDFRTKLRERLMEMAEQDYFEAQGPNGLYAVKAKLYDEWDRLHTS